MPEKIILPVLDRFNRIWTLPSKELCPECGQPDNTGDCNHTPLSRTEAERLGARFVPEPDDE